MRLVRNTFQLISAGVILMTFLSYLAPYINPAIFSWLTFFGTAFPWLLLVNFLLFGLWAWRYHRFALYHLGILLLGWSHITAFIGTNTSKDVVPEQAFTVVTHNLGRLFIGVNAASDLEINKKATEYAAFLKQEGTPDILCTQETKGQFYHVLAEKMGYIHTFNLKKGTVIMSRFPLTAGGDIPFGKTSNSTLWADAKLPDGRLMRIYNVHLQSNKVTSDTEKVIEDANLKEEATWQEIGRVLRKVGGATSVRAEQAQRLRDHILECDHPVLLCGDFNDTPNSYVYGLLADGLTDTFQEKGFGRGTTFGGALPMLRIDYILLDPALQTFSCRVVRDGGFSDHYPVWAAVGF